MVIARVGHRSAHRPHRMHRSSSLMIAPADEPAPRASFNGPSSGAPPRRDAGTSSRQASGQISTHALQRMHRSESNTVSMLHQRHRDASIRACSSV